jgi:predicted dehydrogenase
MAPDLSIGILRFANGVIARITCGLVAPMDHSLTIVGEAGVLSIRDAWDTHSPISVRRRIAPVDKWDPDQNLSPTSEYPLCEVASNASYRDAHDIDFAAGLSDIADALLSERAPRLSAEHAVHVLEVVLALQGAGMGSIYRLDSDFPGMMPMPSSGSGMATRGE